MKHLSRCRLCVASADRDYDESIYFEYTVSSDDGLTKKARWAVSGINLSQSISDIWDDIVTQVEADEGI